MLNINLYNENCLDSIFFMEDHSVNVIMTSPPYNTSKKRGTWSKDQKTHYDVDSVDAMSDEEYIDFSLKLFKGFENILVDNGVVLYNISYSTEKPDLIYKVISEIIKNTDFTIADTISWKKSSALPNNMSINRLTRICEFVFVFCRKTELKTFYMNKTVLSVRPNGIKQYNVYYNFVEAKNNDGSNKLNKATYSSELCEKLLSMYAPVGGTVYDPFMGTGTTAIACARMNLKCYGSELSSDQVKFTLDRIKNEFGTIEGVYCELEEEVIV